MDTTGYSYKGKVWRLCPTTPGNDSFFHSAFGLRTEEGAAYFDKLAKYRRMRWATFLTYFENEQMPCSLADVLRKCFSASNKYQHVSIDDERSVGLYAADVMTGEQPVNKEELHILATLENVKMVVLSHSEQDRAILAKPNPGILGSYQNAHGKINEVVLCLEGNTFSRLELAKDPRSSTIANNKMKKTHASRYRKGRGNAGVKGVEYQVNLLALVILNALRNSLPQWKLSTENEDAGKFDDVVLEWSEGTVLIQSKHKEDDKKRITLEELTSTNSKHNDFSLPKYFLWFQIVKKTFNVKNVIICTNADVQDKALEYLARHDANDESLLHYQDGKCPFYTFKSEIVPELKEKTMLYYHQNFTDKGVEASAITDENLNDFLHQLQLYFNYPPIKRLEKIIDNLLSRTKLCSSSQSKISHLEVYCKVMDWFQKRDGLYFTEIHAKAMCAELRSDKYCQKLEQYKVCFKRNAFDLQGQKQVFQVVTRHGYLLQLLKIYQTLHANKARCLYVNPDDDIDAQKQIIEAFKLPQYDFLVTIWPKTAEGSTTLDIHASLKDLLGTHESKRVILVTEDDEITQQIGFADVVRLDQSVTFGDFASITQQQLLKQNNIIFQGDRVSMAELFPEGDGNAVDPETLEKLVRKEDVKVGAPPSNLDEHMRRYYITRTFNRTIVNAQDENCDSEREVDCLDELQCEQITGASQSEEISEKRVEVWGEESTKEILPEDSIFSVNEKLVVIADDAGMGKSTVLVKLAETVKKNYPHLWVIGLTLNDFTRILGDALHEGQDTIDIKELLNSKDETKLTSHLEERVFTTDQKVVLMLDGIDEISPDYTDLVLGMVKRCQEKSNFFKIFVTTRSHMAAELEAIFDVKAFALQPFTPHNQLDFLTSYWTHNLELKDHASKEKCKRFAEQLIRKISWTNLDSNRDSHFASFPLHVRMAAEIFQERTRQDESVNWGGCKEYVVGDEVEIGFAQTINVTKLYDLFFKKKWDIFYNKENPERKTWANRELSKQFDECRVHHRSLALKVIVEEDKSNGFSNYQPIDEHMETRLLKIGIVQKCNGKLDFIHRTFADYYLAEMLYIELQQNQGVEFQSFLLDTILLGPQYNMTRIFLDGFLRNTVDSLPCNCFERYQSLNKESPSELYAPRSQLLHVLAQEGCMAILQLILKSIDAKIAVGNVELNIRDETGARICGNTLTVLQQLTRQAGINIKDEKDRTPLHSAARKGHVEMLQFLIEPGPNLDEYKADINITDKYGLTAIHLAASSDRPEAVTFLKERGLDFKATTNFGHTLLHLATVKGNLEMVETVLQLDIDSKARDKEGYTAMHLAACFGQLDTIKLLVERGLDFNVTNNHGHTLLHSAGARGHLDTLKFLLQLGVDGNVRDNFGNSVLHQATCTGRLDIIEYLVKRGLDFTVTNNFGRSLLHSASSKGLLETVKFLLKLGVDRNLKENNGYTALHLAAHFGHVETMKFLVESGADVTTALGYTLLHSASANGHAETVDFLLRFGMDPSTKTKAGNTALNLAGRFGRGDVVKLLVDSGIDLNSTDNENLTPLHAASANGRSDMVKFLLDLGADCTIKSRNGNAALHIAACAGHFDVVEILVKHGASLDLPGNLGRTPLHLASEKGHLEIVKFLLQQPVDLKIRDNAGFTALHLAASFGQLDTIELLVEYGADCRVTNSIGRTLLHSASVQGHLETVKYLLRLGVDPKAKDSNENTALHLSVRFGQLEIVKLFFLEHGLDANTTGHRRRTALHLASESGHLHVVKFLLGVCANYGARDEDGYTILHLAVCFGQMDIVRFLVEYGLDFNVKNNHGRSLIHSASANGHLEIAKFLLELGINPNIKGDDGNTALHLATRTGQLDTVKFLVENGADSKALGNHNRPLLHFASEGGHLHLTKFLLELGTDLKIVDKDGHTALHVAANFGRLDIIKYLVEHGIDFNVANKSGRTPLYLASANGHFETVKLLLEIGADYEIRDNEGNTALHLAARSGHLDIVKLLVQYGQDFGVIDDKNRTLLHSAGANGHLEIVRFLLELGVDCKVKGETGNTILHLASGYGHLDVVRLLAEHGLDFNDKGHKDRTPLHMAGVGGRLDTVEFLLERGVDTAIKDSECYTPLHLAAAYGKLETVEQLAESGVSFNVTDVRNRTPLHSACAGGYLGIAKLLLQLGADATAKDKDGYTPLHLAANFGRTATVKYLAQYGLDLKVTNNTGRTLLHSAGANGHLATVILLRQLGIDSSVRDKDGYTALHLAACSGQLKVLTFLFQCGSDVNVTDREGRTLLHSAAAKGHLETVEFLLRIGVDPESKTNSGNNALHLAATSGKLETVKLLVERGMDVNGTGYEGRTSLHYANVYGHLETIKLLIELGARASIKDEEGRTALHLAAHFGHFEIVKFLVEQGLEFSEPDKYHYTPMHLASINGYTEIVRFLLKRSVEDDTKTRKGMLHFAAGYGEIDIVKTVASCIQDLNDKDRQGRTALHIASGGGHLDIVKFLLDLKADSTLRDLEGNTALQCAASRGNLDIVKFLIDYGLDFKVTNQYGHTLLHSAGRNGHLETVKYLLGLGVDVKFRDNYGDTVLHLAVRFEHLDTARFLVKYCQGLEVLDAILESSDEALEFLNSGDLTALQSVIESGQTGRVRFVREDVVAADRSRGSIDRSQWVTGCILS